MTRADDGYSGTNFNRPDFQRMLSLVEEDRVAVICVKDLSRLGRNYLQTGLYTEVVFPEHNTRFIAIKRQRGLRRRRERIRALQKYPE